MKKDVLAATLGGAFFAVPYLALSVPILPSLVIGAGAFMAGELVFRKKPVELEFNQNNDINKVTSDAKEKNKHILDMIVAIDDEAIKKHLNEIHNNVDKIIKTIEKSPEKLEMVNNFFDYYLPVIVKIIDRYDEIENQELTSSESKKFYSSTIKMLEEASRAFKNIINKLYQEEMIDTDVEMKVLNSMLKADGFTGQELDVKEDNNG